MNIKTLKNSTSIESQLGYIYLSVVRGVVGPNRAMEARVITDLARTERVHDWLHILVLHTFLQHHDDLR